MAHRQQKSLASGIRCAIFCFVGDHDQNEPGDAVTCVSFQPPSSATAVKNVTLFHMTVVSVHTLTDFCDIDPRVGLYFSNLKDNSYWLTHLTYVGRLLLPLYLG